MARILIVEKDDDLCGLLRIGLRQTGYEIEHADDTAQAINKIVAGQPDLVVVDTALKSSDGWAVCRATASAQPPIPTIVISSEAMKGEIQMAKDLGIIGYFVEPLEWPVLLRCIERTISTSQQSGRYSSGRLSSD